MPQATLHIVPNESPSRRKEVPNNLVVQPTPLIDRDDEVVAATNLLRQPETRLLTLIGPGGVGKTRLALQIAEELLDELSGFEDGVFFIELAAISDPDLVIPTIATVFQLREAPGDPLIDTLKGYLRDKRLLLVLDNFEQVAQAGQHISELLAACPQLNILVTSRSGLRLRVEQLLLVPPLPVPGSDHLRPLSTAQAQDPPEKLLDFRSLSRYPSIALFAQRAMTADPDFKLTEGNIGAVAEICRRVDGIPLAIELVAERVALLPPRAILARLEHPLRLLTGGSQDTPTRQQTMRRTLEWSYNLLNGQEKQVFRKLSVFVGSCALEAAEALCNREFLILNSELNSTEEITQDSKLRIHDSVEVLDVVLSLVNNSLLRRVAQGESDPRLHMLETVREFAWEQLESSGEAEAMLQLHSDYYMSLAEHARTQLQGPDQKLWLERLEADHDNLRAVLRRAIERKDATVALRTGSSLSSFWHVRGHLAEGRRWLQLALGLPGANVPAGLRAKALGGVGVLEYVQGNYAGAEASFEQTLLLAEEAGDKTLMARALGNLANLAQIAGNFERELKLYERTEALFREAGDRRNIALALANLATTHMLRDSLDQAALLNEESLMLFREVGDQIGVTVALLTVIELAAHNGDYERARASAHEALAISRELGHKDMVCRGLESLAELALLEGDLEQAQALLNESLALSRDIGDKQRLARTLNTMGLTAAFQGDRDRAAELCRESVVMAREVGDNLDMASCLSGWAQALMALAEPHDRETNRRAAQMLSLSEALVAPTGGRWEPKIRARFKEAVAAARLALGGETFTIAWKRGQTMSLDEAIGIAIEPLPVTAPGGAPLAGLPKVKKATLEKPGGLTSREQEVVNLVSQGLSNKAIGRQLILSERTVEMHVANALHKLGLSSRAQLATWAVHQNLASPMSGVPTVSRAIALRQRRSPGN